MQKVSQLEMFKQKLFFKENQIDQLQTQLEEMWQKNQELEEKIKQDKEVGEWRYSSFKEKTPPPLLEESMVVSLEDDISQENA